MIVQKNLVYTYTMFISHGNNKIALFILYVTDLKISEECNFTANEKKYITNRQHADLSNHLVLAGDTCLYFQIEYK